jgi:peptidoglycan lytic transglycosylase
MSLSLRLGAALCGAALMLCYPQFANAKLSSKKLPTKRALYNQNVIEHSKSGAAVKGDAVFGKASTYNPLRPNDSTAGGLRTASGENYDPKDWTAAIRTTLRRLFGGINFGKRYQPVFALVESNKKRAIVRINDVGPLKPGRVIDLNERAMQYFDPSLKLGILPVKVTPLAGDRKPGPIPS